MLVSERKQARWTRQVALMEEVEWIQETCVICDVFE
jgi:hypothetical protein